MATYKLVLEIEVVEADSPLEAAKTVQDWLRDKDTNWQFYVQQNNRKEVYSVDLTETHEVDMSRKIIGYTPLIK